MNLNLLTCFITQGRCGVGLSLAVVSFANTTTTIGTGNFFLFSSGTGNLLFWTDNFYNWDW